MVRVDFQTRSMRLKVPPPRIFCSWKALCTRKEGLTREQHDDRQPREARQEEIAHHPEVHNGQPHDRWGWPG